MPRLFCVVVLLTLLLIPAFGEATFEKVSYKGWDNCVKLSNGDVELIITTEVGPRIMRYGFVGGQNMLGELESDLGKTGGDAWRLYGGHRLWHAPEGKPRTYWPDNVPVEHAWEDKVLSLIAPTETTTGIQKVMRVSMSDDGAVAIEHTLINQNAWDVEMACWALTVMAKNSRGIYPQEPFIAHTEYLLPARPMVLWHYTNMSDPRWTWGQKYIQLQQDPNVEAPQKIGIRNTQQWAASYLNGELFVKFFPYAEDATYPDFNVNMETFTNADILEIESLGPLTRVASDGGRISHREVWKLTKTEVGATDDAIEMALAPVVKLTPPALTAETEVTRFIDISDYDIWGEDSRVALTLNK